jgi:hypothetical protein
VDGILKRRIVEHVIIVGELALEVALELGQELEGGRGVSHVGAGLDVADAVVVAPRAEDVPEIVATAQGTCIGVEISPVTLDEREHGCQLRSGPTVCVPTMRSTSCGAGSMRLFRTSSVRARAVWCVNVDCVLSTRAGGVRVHLLVDIDGEVLHEMLGEVGMKTSVDALDHANDLTHFLAVELFVRRSTLHRVSEHDTRTYARHMMHTQHTNTKERDGDNVPGC